MPAACDAVEWPVWCARSASSIANVASWISRSLLWAASRSDVARAGVAGDRELAPGRGGPITCSGVTPLTVSPRCTRPKSGPSVETRAAGRSGSKTPGRSCSLEDVRERRAAVRHGDRFDLVAVALEHLAVLELDDVEVVAGRAGVAHQAADEIL